MFIENDQVLVLTPAESKKFNTAKLLDALQKQHQVKTICVDEVSIKQGKVVIDRTVLVEETA